MPIECGFVQRSIASPSAHQSAVPGRSDLAPKFTETVDYSDVSFPQPDSHSPPPSLQIYDSRSLPLLRYLISPTILPVSRHCSGDHRLHTERDLYSSPSTLGCLPLPPTLRVCILDHFHACGSELSPTRGALALAQAIHLFEQTLDLPSVRTSQRFSRVILATRGVEEGETNRSHRMHLYNIYCTSTQRFNLNLLTSEGVNHRCHVRAYKSQYRIPSLIHHLLQLDPRHPSFKRWASQLDDPHLLLPLTASRPRANRTGRWNLPTPPQLQHRPPPQIPQTMRTRRSKTRRTQWRPTSIPPPVHTDQGLPLIVV